MYRIHGEATITRIAGNPFEVGSQEHRQYSLLRLGESLQDWVDKGGIWKYLEVFIHEKWIQVSGDYVMMGEMDYASFETFYQNWLWRGNSATYTPFD